nr:unnamed protein product [Callosobruchus analis]
MQKSGLYSNDIVNSIKEKIYQTDTLEIQAFFGLLYFLGVFKSGHEDRSLWATHGTGLDIFRRTVPLARFSFLLCCLRFDDEETRKERMKENKLVAISEVFDLFIRNCPEMFSPALYNELRCLQAIVEWGFMGKVQFNVQESQKGGRKLDVDLTDIEMEGHLTVGGH